MNDVVGKGKFGNVNRGFIKKGTRNTEVAFKTLRGKGLFTPSVSCSVSVNAWKAFTDSDLYPVPFIPNISSDASTDVWKRVPDRFQSFSASVNAHADVRSEQSLRNYRIDLIFQKRFFVKLSTVTICRLADASDSFFSILLVDPPLITYVLIYISLLCSENVSEEDRSNFLSLLELYSSIGQHENVVKFYGVCTVGG